LLPQVFLLVLAVRERELGIRPTTTTIHARLAGRSVQLGAVKRWGASNVLPIRCVERALHFASWGVVKNVARRRIVAQDKLVTHGISSATRLVLPTEIVREIHPFVNR
jgi:hypothetical protein